MEPENLVLRVLQQIRDAVVETNARIDQTNARLEQTNERLDQSREELSRAIVESELRTATAITELAGAVGVRDLLAEQLDLRPRVEACEANIRELERRIGHER